MDNVRNTKMNKENPFVMLAAINVNDKTEKKNGLTYLSWAWAVDQLMRHDPKANWEFHEPKMYGETMMVSCTVTAFDKAITMHLPVMDHRNQAIKNPDAFQVNKNMMRCLAKAIACHGLGLYIFSGDDLPVEEKSGNDKEELARIESLKQVYLKEADKGTESFRAFFNSQSKDDRNSVWSLYEKPLKDAMTNADKTLKRAA
jgi:hypothetical protein